MPRLLIALSVVALLSAGVALGIIRSVHALDGSRDMVVDSMTTFLNPGGTHTLGKGDRIYAEGVLFSEGTAGVKRAIGEFKADMTATEPVGTTGGFTRMVFVIAGEGQIHFSVLAKAGEPAKGVIIGGTGRFRRHTGEITSLPLGGGAVRHVIQFNQNSS